MIEVILDTETTGLSVSDGHRIVEIGCIEINNLIPTKKQFHCYLNPERKVSEQAFKVHGYTDEFLSKQKKFSEIVDDFLMFIKNKRLVIHNAEFDISHLNNELALLGKSKIQEEIIDTLQIARDKFPGSGNSLDMSRREKHTAIIDCELLSKVYINLLDQKEPSFELNNDESYHMANNIEYSKEYFKKIIKPTEDEVKLHNNFLKREIKKNNFN